MASILRPALIIVVKRLPVIVSLIENNELTTPVAIDETIVMVDNKPTTQMVSGVVDLFGLLKTQYPREIELFTAIQGHCNKSIYLLTEGELKLFLLDKEAIAIKRISDTIRDAGLSINVRERIIDLLLNAEEDEFEWLPVDAETIDPLDLSDLHVPIPASWTPAGMDYGLATNIPVTPTTPTTTTPTIPNGGGSSNWTPAGSSFGTIHTPLPTSTTSQDPKVPSNWTPSSAAFGATHLVPIHPSTVTTGPIKATFNGVVLETTDETTADQGTADQTTSRWTPAGASFNL